MDINANIRRFLDGGDKNQGLQPEERYASFDYCFNYFQSFREAGVLERLSDKTNMEQSCLQIGFYLASWGMLRGSSFLLQKSVKFYEPLICVISSTPTVVWRTDIDCYTPENIGTMMQCSNRIVEALGGCVSPILLTKIMLGVFGNVPVFDTYFVKGLGIRWTGEQSLNQLADFYQSHKAEIDSWSIFTLDFSSGEETHRKYPKAKIIDMIGFIEGLQK